MRKTEDNVLVDVDLFASKSQVGSLPPRVLPSEIREFRQGRKLSFTFMRKEEIDDPKSILTLFCIHGSMANQNQFGDLLTALQKDLAQQDRKYNVVCFDALGCGESDKPKDMTGDTYSPENILLDAVSVLQYCGSDNIIIISHSFGTSITARLIQTPVAEKVKAVILMGTTKSIPDGGHPIFKLPVFILECLQPKLSAGFVKIAFSPKTDEELKHKILAQSNRNEMSVCKAFYSKFKWAKDRDWTALRSTPVLILQGKDDMITSFDGAQLLFDTFFSGEGALDHNRLVAIPDAGHQLMQEKPVQCSSAIIDFLNATGFIGYESPLSEESTILIDISSDLLEVM